MGATINLQEILNIVNCDNIDDCSISQNIFLGFRTYFLLQINTASTQANMAQEL